jgi:hypothetical protein
MILTIKKKLQKRKDDSVLGRSACEALTWQIQESFVSFAIPHVVVLHWSLPAPAKNVTSWWAHPPLPRDGPEGGGGPVNRHM